MAKEKSGYVSYDETKGKNVPIEELPEGKVTVLEGGMNVIQGGVLLPVVYNNVAYAIAENNGRWHCIHIEFNDLTLETAPAKILESNTEKSIVLERLQICLLGRDFL